MAGAYPLRRPPDAWSPGLPALPGPCYWLVPSGTPMGWRGGCLAAGLVRSPVCYFFLGGCSALVVCAQRSRQVCGFGAGSRSCFSPGAPPCPRVPRGACCGLYRPAVPSLRLPVRHSMRFVRSEGSVRLPFGSAPRVPCVCVRSCFPDVRPPPPPVGVARTLRAVPLQGAGRALPGGSCPSAFPAPVPCSAYLALGGLARSLRPLAWLGVARPPAGRPLFLCWLCALWGRHKGARGERLSLWVWGVRGRVPSHARPPVLGAYSRGPLPTGFGCGGCCPGDRSPTQLRALLRAGFARCGGGTRAPGGGPLAWVWGVRGRWLSHARPPVLGACGQGPLPNGCGCGECGRGDPSPTPQRALPCSLCALWGRQEGARGGASCLGVGRPGVGRSPPPDRLSLGSAAGARYPLAVGAGGVGTGTRHQPHSARCCELALRAVGAARGRPGAAPVALVWGVRGWAPSHADCPSLGRAAGARHPLAVGGERAGVGTRHLPDSARSCKLALRAVGAARGRPGGAPLAWVWALLGSGAICGPTAHPWGVRPGPATHLLWMRAVWAWGPATLAFASWLCVLWGRQEAPRGGASCPGAGRLG